jgi:hypothetical protein
MAKRIVWTALYAAVLGEPKLLSDLPDGEFQREELDEAKPLSGGKIPPVDPPAG